MPTIDLTVTLEKMQMPEEALKEAEKNPVKTCKTLFENIINLALSSQGNVPGPKQRTLFRLLTKLDDAATLELELEQSEVDLLKEIFLSEKYSVTPALVRPFGMYQQKIEKL